MTDEKTRELQPHELDIEQAINDLMLVTGGAFMALGDHEMGTMHYRGIPFLRALCRLARDYPKATRNYWATALHDPMPFGGEAIGMPRVAVGVGGEG